MNLYQNVSKHKHETFNDETIKNGLECRALEYDPKSDSIRLKKKWQLVLFIIQKKYMI